MAWVFTFDYYQYLTGRNEKTVNWISGVNLTEGKYYTYQMISLYGNLKFRCVTLRLTITEYFNDGGSRQHTTYNTNRFLTNTIFLFYKIISVL